MPFYEQQLVNHPVSLDAPSKKANELMTHTYSHLCGLLATWLRFFAMMEQVSGLEAIKNYQPMQPGNVVTTASDTQALKFWIDLKISKPIEVCIENFSKRY